MTRIEKAVKIVSDLYDFYRKIPKVSTRRPTRDEEQSYVPGQTTREGGLRPSSGRLEPRR